MAKKDETTLLIKLPPELKGAFQGLCKARGVTVSAELRRFMADQLAGTTEGISSADKGVDDSRLLTPRLIKTTRKKTFSSSVVADESNPIRCDSTPDMFDDDQDCVTRAFNKTYGRGQPEKKKNPVGGNLGLSSPISKTRTAVKKRKKTRSK